MMTTEEELDALLQYIKQHQNTGIEHLAIGITLHLSKGKKHSMNQPQKVEQHLRKLKADGYVHENELRLTTNGELFKGYSKKESKIIEWSRKPETWFAIIIFLTGTIIAIINLCK